MAAAAKALEPVLELECVSKSFDGLVDAVHEVSFDVQAGEMIVLLGESGCGKTTTLKMINRLVEPTSGQISILGRDVRSFAPADLRRSIGYVFQGIGLFPHMTIAENVGITPKLLGWAADDISERVGELLDLVGMPLAEFGGRSPEELSGGQQQRVGFARALAAAPEVMLLDEPFGALDPITRDRLQREFMEIQQQFALTAVLVTHDMNEALLMADRVLVMREGEIEQMGTPGELVRSPATPYVAALMDMPRRQAAELDAMLQT